jgi:hypothetical protein
VPLAERKRRVAAAPYPAWKKLQRLHKRQQIFVELVLVGQREA